MNEQLKQAIMDHRDGKIDTLPTMNTILGESKGFSVTGAKSNRGTLHGGRLEANNQVITVGEKPYEPGTIPGIDSIMLSVYPGVFYDYTIHVFGGCPSGKWSNKMKFTDESGDTYTLRIIRAAKANHTVNYHSPAGAIVKIEWDI